MKRVLFSFFLILICPAFGLAAEANYPPPPQPGQTISIDDTIYGVLRTHRNLRGMMENRDALEHEVDRARAGFGPRIDVSGQAGYGVISDSTSRVLDHDRQMWSVVGYSATLVQPIWDGFAARSRVRSAKSTLESVKHRVFDTATSLSLDGVIAHIDLLRRRTVYDLSVKNVDQHKAVLAMTRERANLGADTAADVSQAQSRLYRAL